jgi:hypothetical protein
VLTEAVMGAKIARAISYSRRKEHYVGQQRYFGDSYSFNTILAEAITRKHKAVADVFCSDAGVVMMRIDGDIAVEAMLRCVAKGIAALPVHDSIIVPARCADQTAEIMMGAFTGRFPNASP